LDTTRKYLLAMLAGGVLSGLSLMATGAAPALAQLPPGWTPGTFYQNVSYAPYANQNWNPMPKSKPTDPPATAHSSSLTWSGWTIDGWQATPPATPTVSTDGASGEYCTDATGGTVWVPAGQPADQLTCPTPDSGS
jgi:hypothetical protein